MVWDVTFFYINWKWREACLQVLWRRCLWSKTILFIGDLVCKEGCSSSRTNGNYRTSVKIINWAMKDENCLASQKVQKKLRCFIESSASCQIHIVVREEKTQPNPAAGILVWLLNLKWKTDHLKRLQRKAWWMSRSGKHDLRMKEIICFLHPVAWRNELVLEEGIYRHYFQRFGAEWRKQFTLIQLMLCQLNWHKKLLHVFPTHSLLNDRN